MYADQIVDAIEQNRLIGKRSRPDGLKETLRLKEQFVDIAGAITEATKYSCEDLADWSDQELFDTLLRYARQGILRLPMGYTWIEGPYSKILDGTSKLGFLLYAIDGGIKSVPFCSQNRSEWFSPNCAFFLKGLFNRMDTFLPVDRYEDIEFIKRYYGKFTNLSFTAIFGIMTGGARMKDVEPPHALQRSRAKHAKRPLFSYHLLEKCIPGGEEDHRTKTEGPYAPRRRHEVAGFYRRPPRSPIDAPKTVFVEKHERGLLSAGFVDKDYRVRRRPPNEPRPET